ncbi:MAG: EF-P lysine aminoacylase EpmA [Planctomycetaceae bacterium]
MSNSNHWKPTAALTTLARRAHLARVVRDFFDDHGYVEVETPLLSRDIVVDAWLEPFVVPPGARKSNTKERERFLQTSPEFGMKRLLAAGATAIWQMTRSFRHGERGPLHNPEFTIVEWYRVGDTHREQMCVVEELTKSVFRRAGEWSGESEKNRESLFSRLEKPFETISYDEAFVRHAGVSVLSMSTAELCQLATDKSINVPGSLQRADRDGWLNLLLSELIEPYLGRYEPVFLYDYPASQAALAKVRRDDPPVVERFELYIDGIELCNGYHELTDAAELERRVREQSDVRDHEGRVTLPTESHLLDAMRSGLPDCAGVALGFDRLVMLALGAETIDDVIAFPFDRA